MKILEKSVYWLDALDVKRGEGLENFFINKKAEENFLFWKLKRERRKMNVKLVEKFVYATEKFISVLQTSSPLPWECPSLLRNTTIFLQLFFFVIFKKNIFEIIIESNFYLQNFVQFYFFVIFKKKYCCNLSNI